MLERALLKDSLALVDKERVCQTNRVGSIYTFLLSIYVFFTRVHIYSVLPFFCLYSFLFFFSCKQQRKKKNDRRRKLCKVSSSKKVDVSSTLFDLFLILTRKSLGHFDVLLTKFAHGVLSQSKILQVNGQMLLRINLRFHRMKYLLTLMFRDINVDYFIGQMNSSYSLLIKIDCYHCYFSTFFKPSTLSTLKSLLFLI